MAAFNKETPKVSPDQGNSSGGLTRKKISKGAVSYVSPRDYSSSSSSRIMATIPPEPYSHPYKMNYRYRGKCVVFNHLTFDTGFQYRKGSKIDGERIKHTFENLGFEVEVLLNFEYHEILTKISELSTANYEEHDCICIFVLSHGMSNDLICAKDVIYMTERIWKPFMADKCKSLAGKPKLFFFQACRGEGRDDGITLINDSASLQMNTPATPMSPASDADNTTDETSETSPNTEEDATMSSYKMPTEAHFFIAHSSVRDHCAYRVTDGDMEGTWFIKSLCEVFNKYAGWTDLMKMMIIATRHIATTKSAYTLDPQEPSKKQMPSVTSTLVRSLYLTPKALTGPIP